MKLSKLFLFLLILTGYTSIAQNNDIVQDTNTYRIVKTDGGEILGKILKTDAREILVLTQDNREIIIPQYVVKEITLLKANEISKKGQFIGEDKFATRYFISTNGLPLKKGEHYVQWNLFGPDFQFSIRDNLGVGIMTSWLGIPMIGSIKKNWEINKNMQVAVGALVASFTWFDPKMYAALPFGAISFGDRQKNISFSGGYGFVNKERSQYIGGGQYKSVYELEGRALTSIAGMIKIAPNISLVFESFVGIRKKALERSELVDGYFDIATQQYIFGDAMRETITKRPGFALIIPGLRWHTGEGKAFQFGFAGLVADGETIPVPIPMIQFYRTL